ncbi:MAG: HD-GYP domain-containing protein [Exilispira sp.]
MGNLNITSTSDLADIISNKSYLISSLYQFARTFENFKYPNIYFETISYTINHIKKLYNFSEGTFIKYDSEKDQFYIQGKEIAYKTYEIIPFPADDLLYFAKKSLTITFKIFNDKVNGKLSSKKVSTNIYIPIAYQREILGFLFFESESHFNINSDDISILSIIASQMAFSLKNAQLLEQIEKNFLETINSLVSAIEIKDTYTKGHSSRVSYYTINFAFFINLPTYQIKSIEIASLLHDIGKIGIPYELLNKKEQLSSMDINFIRKHPEMGEHILEPLEFLSKERKIIRHHHERFDGFGYPDKLKGESIPLESRILSLTDSLDAMATDRPYRKALDFRNIILEFKKCSGSQFDPVLAEKFIEFLEKNQHIIRRQNEN